MNKFAKILVSASILTLVVGFTPAQAKAKEKKVLQRCPACHMIFSAKKSKTNPVAVRLKNGTVMYCCAGCKMKR